MPKHLLSSLTRFTLLFIVTLPAMTNQEYRVYKGDFQPTIVLTGTLMAEKAEEFKAPLSNSWQVQIKWMAKEGQVIKPKDTVIRFDTANLSAEIENIRDSIKNKLDEKKQLEADYQFKQFELDVDIKAAENENRKRSIDANIPAELVSAYEYQSKQLEAQKSSQTVSSAQSAKTVTLSEIETGIKTNDIEVRELRDKLSKLQKYLQDATLVSRTSGPLMYSVNDWLERKVQIGDTIGATSTVASIPDLSSMIIEAWVCETHIQQVQEGLTSEYHLDAFPEKTYFGKIREVSRNAESRKQWGKANYSRVLIALDELDLTIMKPGMSVRCAVHGPLLTGMLLIPLPGVYLNGGGFWIDPEPGEPIQVKPAGHDESVLALYQDQNPSVREGLSLEDHNGHGKETNDE